MRLTFLLTAIEQKGISDDEAGRAGTGVAGAGALAGYLVGFREERSRCGYGPVRLGAHLELFADLCRWMEREGVGLLELGSGRVAAFLDDRRRRGHKDLISQTGARPLIGFLVRAGAIPGQECVLPGGPARVVLERYRRYLETERGLTAQTVERYVGLAGRFAGTLERNGKIGWQRVRARDVTRFLLGNCPARRGGHPPDTVPALRSFLRFCHLGGHHPAAARRRRAAGGRAADEPVAEGHLGRRA